ncbi:MAG: glycoside hydrolase family 16 protein, partial [Henriciella sp.]|uniref:glycoside hydrolase family 16 protein n=1 Tax=Henriciella sp. TaxID=1968823 RepID=UPI003C775134
VSFWARVPSGPGRPLDAAAQPSQPRAMMKLLAIPVALAGLAACTATPSLGAGDQTAQLDPAASAAPPPGYTLVWSDEFDTGDMPDPAKWAYDTAQNASGWFNNERQYYSDARAKNTRIEDGHLIIEAHRERLDPADHPDWGEQDYTSARLFTQGIEAWQYGYFEIRAKLPCARGTWPAIWLLPPDDIAWPLQGEIDIMEHVGHRAGIVHGTIHTGDYNHRIGTQKGSEIAVPSACDAFHTYTLDWREDALTIGVDGTDYFTFEDEGTGRGAWPFDKPFFLILNLAIGGDWAGARGIDDTAFPQRMLVDYVRIWQASDTE